MPIMPDGNTFAERQHNAAHYEPTDDERENFIEGWLEKKRKKLGIEYISEALIERANDDGLIEMFKAWGNRAEFAAATVKAVDAYWRPMAEAAADEHDFEADAREAASESRYRVSEAI